MTSGYYGACRSETARFAGGRPGIESHEGGRRQPGGSEIDEAVLDGEVDQIGIGLKVQRLLHLVFVELHRPSRDREAGGDLRLQYDRMLDELSFEVSTVLGFDVRVPGKVWELIVTTKHPSMQGRERDVKEALQSPDEIRKSRSDPAVFLFYRQERPDVGFAR